MGGGAFITEAALADDLARLGIAPGDTVMVHAAMRSAGPLINGPDTLIDALEGVVGPQGTVLSIASWQTLHDTLLDADGRVLAEWREHVAPFDAAASRAARENGVLPEFLRTRPGARRSANPDDSIVAIGAKAEWLTADQPLDYGFGANSPLAKLVAIGGKVLMVGAPHDTMTLLHHAEHLAKVPGKRVRRYEVPFATAGGTMWRMTEEFETTLAVVPGLDDDYFITVVGDFLATGRGAEGMIGHAPSLLVDAAAITAFAVDWLEHRVAAYR